MSLPIVPEIKLKISDIPKNPLEAENKLIVFVKKEKKPRVIAQIISLSLDHGFLRDSKRHIGEKLYLSVKYTLGKSILTKEAPDDKIKKEDREALRYFDRIMDEALVNSEITNLIEKEELMIRKKLFKTVLLQEFYALGERLIGKVPKYFCKNESKELVEFLYNIARKEEYTQETGTEPPLLFNKTYFKTAIILVKSPQKVDLSSHLRALRIDISKGVLSIYIMGWGKHVEPIKADFVKWLKSDTFREEYPDWQVQKIIEYKVPHEFREEIPGICVIYTHKQWLPS